MQPRGNPEPPYHILVMGLGISGSLHITREVAQAVALCSKVFLVHPSVELVIQYLRGLGAEAVDLSYLYQEYNCREEAYYAIAREVLNAAGPDRTIGFAVYGNPALLVAPQQLVIEGARSSSLRVKTLVGISSFDCLLIELGINVAEGLTIFKGRELVSLEQPMSPSLHTLILQFDDDREHQLGRLREYLLRYYPPQHEAVVVFISINSFFPSSRIPLSIGNLTEVRQTLHLGATLYIPPWRAST